MYELSRLDGYLSSPYRFVRIATDAGRCRARASISRRSRAAIRWRCACRNATRTCACATHSGSKRGARSAQSLSLGANYRFYIDDWGIVSHTAGVDATWVPAEAWLLSLGYRFYTQSAASHYAPFYAPAPLPEHYTSDKELTQLSSHRIQLELVRAFALDDLGSALRTVLRVAPAYFMYDNFPLLDSMRVLEVTLSVEVTL